MKIGIAACGAMLLPPGQAQNRSGARNRTSKPFHPAAWLTLDETGQMVVTVHRAEMGQGILTTIAVLIAEELEVDWQAIKTRQAPLDPNFQNERGQTTGASNSVFEAWTPLRTLGAAARTMLVTTAAKRWGVTASECKAHNGMVLYKDKKLAYTALLEEAMQQPLPETVTLKKPSEWNLIGKSMTRLDAHDKVTGKTVFGPDVRLPGMLTAQVVQPPRFGSRIERVDDSAARAIAGVSHVLTLKHPVRDLVFVVAENFWAAKKGCEALKIDWAHGPLAQLDDQALALQRAALFENKTRPTALGEPQEAMAAAARRFEAEYEIGYQAHAPMSPICATARFDGEYCEIWAPMQNLVRGMAFVSGAIDLPPEKIKLYNTFHGGAFGRRLFPEYAAQAAWLAVQIKGAVQLQWTREDDLRQGFFHPATTSRMAAGLAEDGMPVAWIHRLAGLTGYQAVLLSGLQELDYAIPNALFEAYGLSGRIAPPVPTGPYRSVGKLHNVFARECFIDELAHQVKADPYQYRLALLQEKPRLRAVLQRAAEAVGWPGVNQQGRGWGLAVNANEQAYDKGFYNRVAVAAEVQADAQNGFRLTKVIVVVDCGLPIDPDNIEAQVRGGVVWALNTVLKTRIHIKDGAVVEGNFDTCPVIRMSETPPIDVIILPSDDVPTGVGEISSPCTLAAVCNALFAATGKRVRSLPVTLPL